jgi:hypothetical protein
LCCLVFALCFFLLRLPSPFLTKPDLITLAFP